MNRDMRGTVGCYALIDMAANHILLLSTIPLVLLYELYHALRRMPPPIIRQLHRLLFCCFKYFMHNLRDSRIITLRKQLTANLSIRDNQTKCWVCAFLPESRRRRIGSTMVSSLRRNHQTVEYVKLTK